MSEDNTPKKRQHFNTTTHQHKKNTTLAHIALFMVALLYAGNFTIAKEVMPTYMAPEALILMRVLSGITLFWIFGTLFAHEKVERKDFPLIILCSITGIAINQLFFFKGLNLTTPINAALIGLVVPIVVLIVSVIFLHEKLTLFKVVGVVLGIFGATFLILYGQQTSLNPDGWIGDILVFINAASFAIYLVIVTPLMKKYHPMTVIKWVFTFGLLFVLPFSITEFQATDWQAIPTEIWWAILYVMIGVTFLTYLFNGYALPIVSPTVVSTYIYLQPVLAAIIAISFGKDELTIQKIIASILICAGVFLVSYRRIK